MAKRAFRVELGGEIAIVITDSPGKAKVVTLHTAEDAGYYFKFTDARVRRVPEFDYLAGPLPCSRRIQPDRAYDQGFIASPCRCSQCKAAEKEVQADERL